MSREILKVENLSMRFGGLLAVNGVALTVKEKQVVALIGPNGAGKSTCFACLAGQQVPTAGDLWSLYQTMVGIWPARPVDAAEKAALSERLQQYKIKAMREARIWSSMAPSATSSSCPEMLPVSVRPARAARCFLSAVRQSSTQRLWRFLNAPQVSRRSWISAGVPVESSRPVRR